MKSLGDAGRLALGCDVERTGQLVGAVLYVVYGRLCAVNLDRLYGVVQCAEGDVADGLLVACDARQNDVGLVCDFRVCGGIVNLLAVGVLLLDAGQLNDAPRVPEPSSREMTVTAPETPVSAALLSCAPAELEGAAAAACSAPVSMSAPEAGIHFSS